MNQTQVPTWVAILLQVPSVGLIAYLFLTSRLHTDKELDTRLADKRRQIDEQRERADRMEAEVARLNSVLTEKTLPQLSEWLTTLKEATFIIHDVVRKQ